MAHKEQQEFCLKVKALFPHFFENQFVLDIGSLDINGNNRYLFDNCHYLGLDIGPGPNVDIVCKTHEFHPNQKFTTIISTECFEHDMFYKQSLQNIISLLDDNSIFLFTCATTGRPEHGTRATSPIDAPLLQGDWADYYKNLTEEDIKSAIDVSIFSNYWFEINSISNDLYFYGIK